jgi:hypothetical protein
MKYSDVAWAAVCYFYRSGGDNKYVEILSDAGFLNRLRDEPCVLSGREFEQKAILGFVKIENYDLLMKQKLATSVLGAILEMEPLVAATRELTILTADLSDVGSQSISRIAEKMYRSLNSVSGLWSTGASKILHLLNDRLFPIITPGIMRDAYMPEFSMASYMRRIQYQAVSAREDFLQRRQDGEVDAFLSEKLGYTKRGCQKSLVKFIDEYYYLYTSGLPVPPVWTPAEEKEYLTAQSPH